MINSKLLLWISESEYPFQVVYWHDLEHFSQETLLQQNNYNPDTKVTIKELQSFFSSATKEQDWHNKEEHAEVQRYQLLVSNSHFEKRIAGWVFPLGNYKQGHTGVSLLDSYSDCWCWLDWDYRILNEYYAKLRQNNLLVRQLKLQRLCGKN
ncbi:MAG: nuclease A inhibitor family protein [Pleurocapsa sp. MO_192.B19]|nr:nuclease A inhibitor family protein [Pleurocapsa sp. MO_192.B19]